jgi:hypothetical protein
MIAISVARRIAFLLDGDDAIRIDVEGASGRKDDRRSVE